MANNNRAWFQAHKAEYDAVRQEFERGVAQALVARCQSLSKYDSRLFSAGKL